jgi:N-acetylglucosaminyl-diphospho-decaprenol L-rhamnosyltransferase
MSPPDPVPQVSGLTSTTAGYSQPRGPAQARQVDCAVVVVTYNSARDVVGLLESLPAAAGDLTLRTVVVDNGSTDATVDLVRAFPGVRCVETGTNLGYAGGINVGREHAGDYAALLVLNPDVVLEPGALREMTDALDDPGVGIVAPMLLDSSGRRYPSLRRDPTLRRAIGDGLLGGRIGGRPGWLSEMVRDEAPYGRRHAVDWAVGAALLISAACDRAVGQWDERFFLYSEETDYGARARAAGFRAEYLPTARVRHRGGGSGQSSALLALNAVNRIRYMEKRRRLPRAYRAAVILHELLRCADSGHRTALRFVLRRSSWPALLAGLQDPTARKSAPARGWRREPVANSIGHPELPREDTAPCQRLQ